MANFEMAASVMVLLMVYLHHAEACTPFQGFHLITNMPERGRGGDDIYLYALQTEGEPGGDIPDDTIEISKDGGLPSSIVETGVIEIGPNIHHGCYLRVRPPIRMKGVRYGHYTATYIPGEGSIYDENSGYTFVRPQSKILDTRGVYTVTIYPSAAGETSLSDESPSSIGVAWSPGCRKIQWRRGKAGNINTGPKLDLTSTEDAGLYTISRGTRGKRGWFVQILVIAADCPFDQWWNGGICSPRIFVETCSNGGVLRNAEEGCICPPLFGDPFCGSIVNEDGADGGKFVIGHSNDLGNPLLQCKDLPGGNEKCRGYLFCYGDLYGCTCGSGWYGNNCDKPCRKGRWGASCSQRCPDSNSACDRFFGN